MRQLLSARASPEKGWPLRVVCMNKIPSSWGTKIFKPEGDSGWHTAVPTAIESEKEESCAIRDKEEGWPMLPPGPTHPVTTVAAGRVI